MNSHLFVRPTSSRTHKRRPSNSSISQKSRFKRLQSPTKSDLEKFTATDSAYQEHLQVESRNVESKGIDGKNSDCISPAVSQNTQLGIDLNYLDMFAGYDVQSFVEYFTPQTSVDGKEASGQAQTCVERTNMT